jgi:L-ribulose-5-phosphate 3-epimerase
MKKGIHDVPFLAAWRVEQFLAQASNAGFRGIELNVLEEEGYLPLHSSPVEIKRIAGWCKEFGLEIPSLSTSLHNPYSLASKDPRIRQRGIDVAIRMIEIAFVIGADIIQVVPGVIASDAKYDEAYKHAQESLAFLAREAKAAGVVIGVENVSNKFLPSPKEYSGFLNEINDSHIKGYFDTGNAMVTGYPEHWIPLLGSNLAIIHVKDFQLATGAFTSPLAGDINWPVVIAALRQISFKGYMISTPPRYLYAHERLMESASRDLDAIFGMANPASVKKAAQGI